MHFWNRWRHPLKWWLRKHWKNRSELEQFHSNRAIFWCANANDLPSPQQLREAVATRLQGILLFSRWLNVSERARCVEAVRAALPGCWVNSTKPDLGFDSVYFTRVLSREEILANADELMESAREFRVLATQLCAQLAALIGISTRELAAHAQYQLPQNRIEQRGSLNDEWSYCFHGFQCGFTHKESGQSLDVEFGFGDEFGVLDAWFWLRFLQTTPRYALLGRWLALGYGDAKTMLDSLYEAGYLFEITGFLHHAEVEGGWERRGLIATAEIM